MYLLYVDESGDCGLVNSPTRYYALSGLVVHELAWPTVLERTIEFRRKMKADYGLKLKEEIHAARFFHSPGKLQRIKKYRRLALLRDTIDFQASLKDAISIINVLIDKQSKSPPYDVFDRAWTVMIQRFYNTIKHRNFPGAKNSTDYGTIVCDKTDERKLRSLARKMRRYNNVPSKLEIGSRPILIDLVIDDPVHRDSLHSYFIQLSDVNAYFLVQKHAANGYIKSKGGVNYFDRLHPSLCKVAATSDKQGIVRL